MKKLILIAFIISGFFPFIVRANNVSHYSKDEVVKIVSDLIDNMSGTSLSDEELDSIRDINNGIKQNVTYVKLASFGPANRSFKLELIDTATNTVLTDVKWYYYIAYPRTFQAVGENLINNPVASLQSDGTVSIIRGAGQGEAIWVWAEYNKSLYRFVVEPMTEAVSKEEMGRAEARRIVEEKNWKDLPSKAAKVEAVYNYLIESIKYDFQYIYKYYNYFYGALIDKLAVCNGYSKVFVYMMSLLDINAQFVSGWIEDDSVSHAWAYVKLDDNKWYLIDPTYGDSDYTSSSGIVLVDYYYFLQNLEEFNTSHHTNKEADPLYVTGDKFRVNYYKENNLIVKTASDLENIINNTSINAIDNSITLNFAKLKSDILDIESIIKKIYPNAKVLVNNTNEVRLGGSNEGYYLYDYTGYLNIKKMTDAKIILNTNVYTYIGKEIEPNYVVKYNDLTLQKDIDYKVTYIDNDKPGTALIKVVGINSYEGEIQEEFTIIPSIISFKEILKNAGYRVNNNIVSGFSPNTLKNVVSNTLGKNIIIESQNEYITTGTNISFENESFVVVIKGDLNGDGLINSADLLKMRQHLLKTSVLQNAYLNSGLLVTTKNIINSSDLLKLRRHLLEIELINQ